MKLIVINYSGSILLGKLKEWNEEELVLSGVLSLEPGSDRSFSPVPLGNQFMIPDPELETRLLKRFMPCYSVFDLENEDHEICQMYNSYWSV